MTRQRQGLVFALAASLLALTTSNALAYKVFVSNEKENTISVLDSETLEVVHTIKTGNRPRGIILANEGKWVIVCASDDHKMQVFDTQTYEYVKDLPSGPDPELPILHTSGNPLYVSNEDDNLVTVVDIFKGTIITDVPVGVEPEGMGMSPDGKVLVNTSETTNMAHFIDAHTYKNIDNVLVDNRPRVAEFTADGKQVWVSAEIGGTVTVIAATAQDHVQPAGVSARHAGERRDGSRRARAHRVLQRLPRARRAVLAHRPARIRRCAGRRAPCASGGAEGAASSIAVTGHCRTSSSRHSSRRCGRRRRRQRRLARTRQGHA